MARKIAVYSDSKGHYIIFKRRKIRLPTDRKKAQKIINKVKDVVRQKLDKNINLNINIKQPRTQREPRYYPNRETKIVHQQPDLTVPLLIKKLFDKDEAREKIKAEEDARKKVELAHNIIREKLSRPQPLAIEEKKEEIRDIIPVEKIIEEIKTEPEKDRIKTDFHIEEIQGNPTLDSYNRIISKLNQSNKLDAISNFDQIQKLIQEEEKLYNTAKQEAKMTDEDEAKLNEIHHSVQLAFQKLEKTISDIEKQGIIKKEQKRELAKMEGYKDYIGDRLSKLNEAQNANKKSRLKKEIQSKYLNAITAYEKDYFFQNEIKPQILSDLSRSKYKDMFQDIFDREKRNSDRLDKLRLEYGDTLDRLLVEYSVDRNPDVLKSFNQEFKKADKDLAADEEYQKNIRPIIEKEFKSIQKGNGKEANVVTEKGLSNIQIDNMLKKYPQFLGTISHNEIDDKILPRVKKAEQCFIINTDPKSKNGEHWQACYWNPDKNMIAFFDSYGDLPDPVIYRGILKIASKIDNQNHLKFKINRVCQQGNSSNCGFFCIKTLIDLMNGKRFDESTGFDQLGEKKIENFKQKIGFGYLPSFGKNEHIDPEIAFGTSDIENRHLYGGNFIDDIKTVLFFPKNKLAPVIQKRFDFFKDIPILEMRVRREPIISAVDKAINLISLGTYGEAKRKLNYDKMFHLSLVLTLDRKPIVLNEGRLKVLIEKNERINIDTPFELNKNPDTKNTEYKSVPMSSQQTIGSLFSNTLKQVGDHRFFQYNAFENNCQDFIANILNSNGLMNSELQTFIKQDAESILKSMPNFMSKISQFTTDSAAKIKEFFGMKNKKRGGILIDRVKEPVAIKQHNPDYEDVIDNPANDQIEDIEAEHQVDLNKISKPIETKKPESIMVSQTGSRRKDGIVTVFYENGQRTN